MTHLFVTGTGTNVGKTVIARAIIRALTLRGLKIGALKPVESGVAEINDRFCPGDAEALRQASLSEGSVEDHYVYAFRDPVSPHLAAEREHREINPNVILSRMESIQRQSDILITEGAGGLLVPLSSTLLYADLIARTDARLLIVAPDILGSINATLLTIEAAWRRHLRVAGVVLNGGPNPQFENARAISAHSDVPILGTFPDCTLEDSILAETAETHLDLDRLLATVNR